MHVDARASLPASVGNWHVHGAASSFGNNVVDFGVLRTSGALVPTNWAFRCPPFQVKAGFGGLTATTAAASSHGWDDILEKVW